MRTARITQICLAVVVATALTLQAAHSCPFCSAPSLTLSEQVAQSDAVALIQWVSGEKSDGKKAGSTTYEIVRLVKQPSAKVSKEKPIVAQADAAEKAGNTVKGQAGKAQPSADPASSDKATGLDKTAATGTTQKNVENEATHLKSGTRITLNRFRTGKKGDLFLLMGTLGTVIEWGSPLEVTETSFNYVAQSPLPETPPAKRLAYFVKFLEFPDQLVSTDAYAEFANAPYKHIAPMADKLPREKIRQWITSDDTPQTRLGLYGLLLGLCGTEEDAKLMAQKIIEQTDDFRLGIDGVISGYLLLKGAEGLKLIDETKLRATDVPFSETYAAMQALRFMWSYAEGRIEKERLRQSMRILLDRPELADLVIADLARWKDWSVQDRLMTLYGAEEYNIPSIKRAIVRYLLVSTKFKKKSDSDEVPAHVTNGKKHLEALRERDPKTVKDAERFFFLN